MDFTPSLKGLQGYGQRRPLHSRLAFLYFALPSWVKSLARAVVMKRQGDSKKLVIRYLTRIQATPLVGPQIPLLLTHDVDTLAGFRNLASLLSIEEQNGFTSLSFLVTHRYKLDQAVLSAWQSKGHRFAVHDTIHDNRIAYLPKDKIQGRLRAARAKLGEKSLSAFRSPAFLRSPQLYEGLQGEVDFDFSSNDWALAWPNPGDGIGSPFPAKLGKLVCVPTNLPRDGEMIALGMSPDQMTDLVKMKARQLVSIGAPAIFLVHPDPGFLDTDQRLNWYGDLLKWFKQSGLFLILSPEDCLEELRRRATQLES